jgi:hypothetical protein
MRVVEHSYPMGHDPYFRFRLVIDLVCALNLAASGPGPSSHPTMGILIRLVGLPNRRRIVPMLAIRITGNQLRAGRALARRPGRARRAVPPLNPQVGDVQPRHPGSDVFAPLPRDRCARRRGRAVSAAMESSALSGESPDYQIEAVRPSINSERSQSLHVGMDLTARSVSQAYATRA